MTFVAPSDLISTRRLEPILANDVITEDSAAIKFIEKHGEDLRYCHTTGAWFIWNGAIWQRDNVGVVYQYARELARVLAEHEADSTRYKVEKTTFATGVEKFCRFDPAVRVSIDFWDADPWLIGTPDGTVDLRSGALRPSWKTDGITKSTAVSPKGGQCPQWLAFLDQATKSDAELIRFLQQWCGYGLTGITREHSLVFVYGPGGNGKGVFLSVVTNIMKAYAATAAMDTFTASKSDKHPTDLAMLRGARVVTASETEEGRAWAEARIKQMTGGDRISARFMRQDFFEYVPQFKLTIIGNHKPVLRNVDDAAKRRFLIVPFNHKPPVKDLQLEAKLMSEAAAILQWMIKGCLDWQQNGLVRPASVMAATEEYFSDQNLFAHWLDDECEVDKTSNDLSETTGDLFKSWRDFAMAAGVQPGSTASFKDKMTEAGFRYYRSRKSREFFGIRIKPKVLHDFHER